MSYECDGRMTGEYNTLLESGQGQTSCSRYDATQSADVATGRDDSSRQKEDETGLKGSLSSEEADKEPTASWTGHLNHLWGEFALKTSLNGPVFIVGSSSKLSKIVWCCLVAAMFVFLVTTITRMCQRYLSYGHATSIEVNRYRKIDFPAVTLCLKSPFDRTRLRRSRHRDVIEQYLMSISSLPFDGAGVPGIDWMSAKVTSILESWTFESLLNDFSLGLEDILLFGRHSNTTSSSGTTLNPHHDFVAEDLLNTRCFTYNAAYAQHVEPLQMNEMQMLHLLLVVPQAELLPQTMTPGIWVSVHDPEERAMPFNLIDVVPGSSVEIRFVLKEYKFLPAPYKSFNNRDCVEAKVSGFVSPLAFSHRYTWAGCVWEATHNYSSRQCSCIMSDSAGPAELSICGLQMRQNCFRPQQEKEMLRQLSGEDGTCLPLCNNRQFTYSWSAVPFPSEAVFQALHRANLTKGANASDLIELRLKLETSLVTRTEHIPSYTADDIYSTLGGEMGLFLGASMVTVMEIIEVVGLSLWTLIKIPFQAR